MTIAVDNRVEFYLCSNHRDILDELIDEERQKMYQKYDENCLSSTNNQYKILDIKHDI